MTLRCERTSPPRWARVALLAAVGLLTVGCTPEIDTRRAKVPAGAQVVEVTMRDHSYAFDEEQTLRPGRVEFRVTNQGESGHDLALAKLPDDVSDISEWLDGDAGGFQPVYVMADRAPGEVGVFATNLHSGQYGMLCLVKDRNDRPHYELGMIATFQVVSGEMPAPR